jgi:hypothetical protein
MIFHHTQGLLLCTVINFVPIHSFPASGYTSQVISHCIGATEILSTLDELTLQIKLRGHSIELGEIEGSDRLVFRGQARCSGHHTHGESLYHRKPPAFHAMA